MLSKTVNEAKERGIRRVRDEIEALARQFELNEKGAYHARAQAALATIYDAGLITFEEFQMLGNEMGAANAKAAEQARAYSDSLDAPAGN
jgi:hypothetical protein